MRTYRTAQVAAKTGIHPNTVRLYEKWGLIPKPARLPNGYRVFTDFHIQQIQLVRLALQVEVLQGGLRAKIIQMLKTAALGDFGGALALTRSYVTQVAQEQRGAEEAISLVKQILSGRASETPPPLRLRRKEAAKHLGISMDTLRNWELNGLLSVKRKENGYRVYTGGDLRRLKIIRTLRRANYSLAAILRMLEALSQNPQADILQALDTPIPEDDIITACDRLITSLHGAQQNGLRIIKKLNEMKKAFAQPSTMPPAF